VNLSANCSFAARCARADDRCNKESPDELNIGDKVIIKNYCNVKKSAKVVNIYKTSAIVDIIETTSFFS